MSEQNQQESNRPNRAGSSRRRTRDAGASRDLSGMDLSSMDDAQQSAHQTDRVRGPRRDTFPKDDRRSSTLLTERERSERWPLG